MAEQEQSAGTARRLRGRAAIAAALGVLLAGPVVLHFAQKRHNRLDFDPVARYPEDRPLTGGEVFAETIIALVDHELNGWTGWRPNDFFLWGPGLWADNNANRQRGILQAVRESLRVFKDHLTKVSSDQYDPRLVGADTAFRNDMEKFWLPSAESKLREGVKYLKAYLRGLKEDPPQSSPIKQRNVELIRLLQAWTDLLGDVHASLYRGRQSFWTTDDAFYYAQGVAHAIYHLARAIQREYRDQIAERPVLRTLLGEIIEALGEAAVLKPLVVLDGRPDGFFANHRRNLDSYITEARQKMYSVREELEK